MKTIICLLILIVAVSACSHGNTSESIENVLLHDALIPFRVAADDPERAKKIADLMGSVDISRTPEIFQKAYRSHIEAWRKSATAARESEPELARQDSGNILSTFELVKSIAIAQGARLPPNDFPKSRGVENSNVAGQTKIYSESSPPMEIGGSTECTISGLGPGNSASCGSAATECVKTGLGPGNAVACGGLATMCDKTGLGPGNSVACGGNSPDCDQTGLGTGNDAACGGLATECKKTGLGPGNDVACGGLASGCESTGLGPGNVTACGGQK